MSIKQTLFVSFSGGRTSAYMCNWLLRNKSDEYDFIFVFANTGLEHEKTLEFVDKCDKHFNLNLVWVEAVVNPIKGKGIRHKIVNLDSAARNGEPFEAYIKKEGIPNTAAPKCSERLKRRPMESYRRELGFKSNHLTCVGIRVDEIDRMSANAKKDGLIYPLIKWTPTTKEEILMWWKDQEFDLEIPEHLGNCVTCFKKSFRKLFTIAKYEPERFDFCARMEKENGSAGPTGKDNNVFFRSHTSAIDLIKQSEQPFNEFKESKVELQLSLALPLLDIEGDCGAACEI